MGPRKKQLIAAASLVLLWLISGCSNRPLQNDSSTGLPNIIVILADDIGVEAIGAYGGEYSTPHIDSLAANGVRFDQGHATPVCTTSRTRLLAGTHNFKHYKAFAHLDPELYTLPRYLKDAGYKSAVAGKWQLSGNMEYGGKGTYPWEAGFDEHIVWQMERTLKGGRYWQPTFTVNHENRTYCKDDFGPTVLNDYILDFIDRRKDEPFFVYYNPILAHDPWTTTPDSLEAETPKEKFSGMMSYLDKMVGRVLNKLDEHGLSENTLIWFIGDNGTHPQITSLRHGNPISGGKWITTTAGTHVPYILQWKSELPAGSVKDGLVDLMDVYSTLKSAVGSPIETKLDGLNLIPYAKGETDHTRDWIFMHYDPQWGADYFNTPMPAAQFIFNQDWKLYASGRFFNTADDPFEEADLSRADLTQEAAQMRQSLKMALDSMNAGSLKPPYLNSGIEAKTVPPPHSECQE